MYCVLKRPYTQAEQSLTSAPIYPARQAIRFPQECSTLFLDIVYIKCSASDCPSFQIGSYPRLSKRMSEYSRKKEFLVSCGNGNRTKTRYPFFQSYLSNRYYSRKPAFILSFPQFTCVLFC